MGSVEWILPPHTAQSSLYRYGLSPDLTSSYSTSSISQERIRPQEASIWVGHENILVKLLPAKSDSLPSPTDMPSLASSAGVPHERALVAVTARLRIMERIRNPQPYTYASSNELAPNCEHEVDLTRMPQTIRPARTELTGMHFLNALNARNRVSPRTTRYDMSHHNNLTG